MMAYFTGLIERRRREPEDDTVSHLVAAGVGADGDMAGMLSILAFTFTMVTGGNDTTTGLLGGAVQLLHQRPAVVRDNSSEVIALSGGDGGGRGVDSGDGPDAAADVGDELASRAGDVVAVTGPFHLITDGSLRVRLAARLR